MRRLTWLALIAFTVACSAGPRTSASAPNGALARAAAQVAPTSVTVAIDSLQSPYFARQIAEKQLTDRLFQTVLGGRMIVRKIAYAGADSLAIPAYLFAPRDTTRPHPVILFVHGGVHADFQAAHLGQVRTLVGRGFVVVAPEYRGSTGYGARFYDAIDYGGKEVDDVLAARDYLAHRAPYADLRRLGIMGYSHGGFIALHAVFRHPELFKVVVAHVPVADLLTRMRTHPDAYQQLFVAQPAFGARLEQNPRPYIERSPIAHVRELRTPLLVHAADNDEDVLIAENHALRDSMIAAGMDKRGLYTYREFHNPPGGHSFGVLDTDEGRASWAETVMFLEKYLLPGATP